MRAFVCVCRWGRCGERRRLLLSPPAAVRVAWIGPHSRHLTCGCRVGLCWALTDSLCVLSLLALSVSVDDVDGGEDRRGHAVCGSTNQVQCHHLTPTPVTR